jgi:hypothetical protein
MFYSQLLLQKKVCAMCRLFPLRWGGEIGPMPFDVVPPTCFGSQTHLGRLWLAAHWDKSLSKQALASIDITDVSSECWGAKGTSFGSFVLLQTR